MHGARVRVRGNMHGLVRTQDDDSNQARRHHHNSAEHGAHQILEGATPHLGVAESD